MKNAALLFSLMLGNAVSADAAPWVVAHRGDEAAQVENSLLAFASAKEKGADFVELDVYLTKDKQILVFHDPDLVRNVDCGSLQKKKIEDVTLAEIRKHCKFKVGVFAEGALHRELGKSRDLLLLPTLEEVISLLKDGQMGIFIELKAAAQREVIELLAAFDPAHLCPQMTPKESFDCYDKIKIISFNHQALEEGKKLASANASFKKLEFIKLVGSGKVKELPTNEELWNLDGVLFDFSAAGNLTEFGKLLAKKHPGKKRLVYTVTKPEDLDKIFSLTEYTGAVVGNLDAALKSRRINRSNR